MWRVICTRDVGPYAFDTTVARFDESQWISADAKCTALRRRWGPYFRLVWN